MTTVRRMHYPSISSGVEPPGLDRSVYPCYL